MKHDSLLSILQETTGQAWDCVDYSAFQLQLITVLHKKDALVLVDETRRAKIYSLSITQKLTSIFNLDMRNKLNTFLAKSKIKSLVPTIKVDLDVLPGISGIYTLNDFYDLHYNFKPKGELALESLTSHNKLIYDLSGTLSSKIQADFALNQFISDVTMFRPEVDLKNRQIKMIMSKKYKIGPVEIQLKLTNLNAFEGFLSLSLKHEEIIYSGWKFHGELMLKISGQLSEKYRFQRNEPVLITTRDVITTKSNLNTILTTGGLVLVGVACVASGGACLAGLGLGGTTLALSS